MFFCRRCRAFCIPTTVRCRICGERQSRVRTTLLHLLYASLMIWAGFRLAAWL
jgi:hypothetical protein